MNLSDLQAEVGEWHRKHFPEATATWVLLKAMSEMGELADSHWKWLRDTTDTDELVNQVYEIGDVVICLLALSAKLGRDFQGIVEHTWAEVKARDAERVRR